MFVWTSSFKEEYHFETVDPVLVENQYDTTVKPILEEYLEHGNTAEVEVRLVFNLLPVFFTGFLTEVIKPMARKVPLGI